MDLNADTLTLLGLIGTWALVIGTIVLLYWQTRQNQVLNSANAVLTLRERFDSDRMRAARRHLSQKLLQGAHEDIVSTEVLTFFELVGAMTRRKILDDRLVWESFGTWITTYYQGARRPVDMIGMIRDALKDPLVFHNLQWLAERMDRIDIETLGREGAAAVEQETETRAFLAREAVLLDTWDPVDGLAPDHQIQTLIKRAGKNGAPPPPPSSAP